MPLNVKKLNPKQQAFADYFIQFGNAEQAALKAGYSKAYARGNAHKLVANVSIKKYIDKRLEEIKSERVADQQEVMEYLTAVMRREHKEVVPITLMQEASKWVAGKKETVKKEVVELVEIPAKLSDANKAAELLGKRYTMWTDNQNISAIVTPTFVDDISDVDD